jgi:FKBP-type peptidyl-prolyl cis-trans isomerase FkpA
MNWLQQKHHLFVKRCFAVLIALSLSACGALYSDEDFADFDAQIAQTIQENGWNMERSESGLYFERLEEGNGATIPIDAKILVTYKGTLLNGQSFDQTGAAPISLHTRTLIEGWREALLNMDIGSSARVIIPPQLGYKNQDLPKIPKNSILVFEMKIHGIE